tara:strand:- start:14779 stop:16584 length:1806 start_codon:yes stop_codon:yes gene_type:complete
MDDPSISGAAPRRSRKTLPALVLKRAALVVAVSLAAAGLAYVALLPDRYEAVAEIALPQGAGYQQEAARMLSQPVLALAVSRFAPALIAELRQGATDTVDITALLQRSVQIRPASDTEGMRLYSAAPNPTSALGLANGLADAYLAIANGDTAALPEPAQDRLLPDPRSPLAAVDAADAPGQALRNKVAAATQARMALEGRADLADNLLAQDNFYALAREFDSYGTMVARVQQLVELQGQRDELAATLLPSHPKMRVLDERITRLSGQLRDDGQQLADAARAAIATARQTETTLKAELDALSATDEAGIDRDLLTGAIGGAAGKLVSVSVEPQQKLVSPAWGAGVSGTLALLAQLAVLLRRPRTTGPHAQDDDAVATQWTAEGDEVAIESTVDQEGTAVAPDGDMPAVWEDDPAAWREPPAPQLPATEPAASPAVDNIAPPAPEPVIAAPIDPAAASKQAPPHIVVVSSSTDARQAQIFANDLLATLSGQGRHVAMVDAGSRLRTAASGISDLAAGRARYADIIQFDETRSLTIVSWGRRASLDLDAEAVTTLIKALGTLCDVVIVTIGKTSSGPQPALLALPGVLHTTAEAPREGARNIAA